VRIGILFRQRRARSMEVLKERYVDSPLDKRASTSASLHVRSFARPSAEPPSAWATSSRVGIVLRACCFFVDVSGDIMASLVVLQIIHIDESATH
jgi:hypothetical protein